MNYLDVILATIAARQPDHDDLLFKVHTDGQEVHVDAAYIRKGSVVNKTYVAALSPSGIDLRLTNFSLSLKGSK